MQAEFRAPRRRCRVREEYVAPLPVRSTSSPAQGNASDPSRRSHFRADIVNGHVLVTQHDHISDIYDQGYFGKGVLSRARPEYDVFDRWQDHQGFRVPVVTSARYEELLGWAESALLARGSSPEAVRQILAGLQRPVAEDDWRRENENGADAEDLGPEPRRNDVSPDPGCDGDPEDPDRSDPEDSDLSDCASDGSEDDSEGSDDESPALVPGPGFVLVASDAGQAETETGELRWNPLRTTECLQLCPEEAFFLVYALGCLSVHLHQEPLSVAQLWRCFVSLRPDFVSSYAAYHHFRSRGWVPKGGSGAKYGVDMVLYRKGPPFYHSSYSVVVEKVDERFEGSVLRPFSWRSLAALSRITAAVSKELLLCYVVRPADLTDAQLDSPACLSRLKVQEVLVSRWVSSKERADQPDI
ncbi:tRNA-splicing endonuclease subunit Sen2 [Stigmatopora argus]